MNRLNWQCCLAGSSKTAPRILIFSIAIDADYSYEVKNSEIWAPAFYKHNNSFIAAVIQERINLANNDSESNAKKVQKWRILRKDFSVPGGELGPTLKMKRHIVMKQYAELVDGFYN